MNKDAENSYWVSLLNNLEDDNAEIVEYDLDEYELSSSVVHLDNLSATETYVKHDGNTMGVFFRRIDLYDSDEFEQASDELKEKIGQMIWPNNEKDKENDN